MLAFLRSVLPISCSEHSWTPAVSPLHYVCLPLGMCACLCLYVCYWVWWKAVWGGRWGRKEGEKMCCFPKGLHRQENCDIVPFPLKLGTQVNFNGGTELNKHHRLSNSITLNKSHRLWCLHIHSLYSQNILFMTQIYNPIYSMHKILKNTGFQN